MSEIVEILAFSFLIFFSFSHTEIYVYIYLSQLSKGVLLYLLDQVDLSHVQDLGDC